MGLYGWLKKGNGNDIRFEISDVKFRLYMYIHIYYSNKYLHGCSSELFKEWSSSDQQSIVGASVSKYNW